ncbi:MAG: radical SAM protein [Phycisphaerae bacterium]
MRNIQDIISRKLLPRVRNPGQYIGCEINSRLRPGLAREDEAAGGVGSAGQAAKVAQGGGEYDVTVCLAFPDTYAVGMSHLGHQVLYQLLNDMPGVACDRTYCPAVDAEKVMREQGVELFGWESRCAVRDFDILGFSLAYEMCVTNVLTMLDLAGIPIRSADRAKPAIAGPPGSALRIADCGLRISEGDGQAPDKDNPKSEIRNPKLATATGQSSSVPIIIAGDALADTPEPMRDFIDLFICGDGEEPLRQLVELVRRMKKAGAGRDEMILDAARTIESVYAPRFHDPQTRRRLRDDVPEMIHRAHVKKLSDSPALTAPLVPLSEAVHERVVIEIMRGCPNACRFCQAGAVRLPVRIRTIDEIIDIARKALAATGYKEISLLSLSTSDYPRLDELIDRLNSEFAPRHVSISLPSLRVGQQLAVLPKLTSAVRKGGLTIAAEAGSDRLRAAIGKGITEKDMVEGVRAAYAAGWRSVKVYFMAGLPGETAADIDAIFDLCRRLSDTRKDVDGHRGAITASVSWFVPKPHTPMQWCAMRDAEYFWSVRNRLRELAHRTPITFRFHRIERSLLEGVLCRGDRRVGAAIEAAWRAGARMDSWDEHFDYALWTAAFAQTGIDPSQVACRELGRDEPLPWGHIRCYRTEEFLMKEFQAAKEQQERQNAE